MYDQNDIIFNEYSLDFFALLNLLFVRLFGGYSGASGSTGGYNSWSMSVEDTVSSAILWLSNIWNVLVVLSWIVSTLLLFGLIYAYIRHAELGEAATAILEKQEEIFAKLHQKSVKNSRWQDVEVHINSASPNDWKLAIIEADIILGELLDSLGYAGNSIGEKLKSASPASFRTLNQAWRAHNTRNRIAHEGGDFELSFKEAKEAVTEYQMVFEEFDFI